MTLFLESLECSLTSTRLFGGTTSTINTVGNLFLDTVQQNSLGQSLTTGFILLDIVKQRLKSISIIGDINSTIKAINNLGLEIV